MTKKQRQRARWRKSSYKWYWLNRNKRRKSLKKYANERKLAYKLSSYKWDKKHPVSTAMRKSRYRDKIDIPGVGLLSRPEVVDLVTLLIEQGGLSK